MLVKVSWSDNKAGAVVGSKGNGHILNSTCDEGKRTN
jgi:hypothetical protein